MGKSIAGITNIVDDLNTSSNTSALSAKQGKALKDELNIRGRLVGDIFPNRFNLALSASFPAFRIDQDITLNSTNHPDIFSLLYNEKLEINSITDFQIISAQDSGGNFQLTFANNADNIILFDSLYSDLQYHTGNTTAPFNYIDWKSITINSQIGGLAAGTYEITNIDPINLTLTINAPFSTGATSNILGSFYINRINTSTTTVKWRKVHDSVIRSPGGDAVPGVRLLDRSQGHRHPGGYEQFSIGSVPSGTALWYWGLMNQQVPDPINDGVNGNPRTGPTTRDRSLSAYLYMYIGTYVP